MWLVKVKHSDQLLTATETQKHINHFSQLHAWKSVSCSFSLAMLLFSQQTENDNNLIQWKPNLIQTKTKFTFQDNINGQT